MTPRRTRKPRVARFIPFAAHQAADYLFGAGLIFFSVHASGGMSLVMLIIGAIWCGFAAVTNGPVGLLRLVGRRPHAIGDVVIAIALGLSPLAVHRHLDWIAVGFAEAVVLVQLRVAAWTAYEGPVAPRPPSSPPTRPPPPPPPPPVTSGSCAWPASPAGAPAPPSAGAPRWGRR